ncbi:hypothetical protein BG011_007634 [Mortierella polycephala]|uniref:Uncharacterized protein n=1 Tax=Mortierella polycephala TaxID=41804 RepID=A0A9P6PS61_9FUNG|nr:hypothetical protein BG011_007634 [Mortierella polycephala]
MSSSSSSTIPSSQTTATLRGRTTSASTSTVPFSDRLLAAEHRFTALTQNIAHFSPLKTQLDKHNIAIERLESEIKKKAALLQSCQEKLKAISKRSQSSRQGSHVSLHASDDSETSALVAQQQAAKEALDSLNGQLLAAKILHIGLTRQVAQYFESRGQLQSLLEEIFSGSTPEHPTEDALERELIKISTEMVKVKQDFENYRAAKNEFKEVRRYVDIWNDAMEKQVASNAKDVTKSLKKFVSFLGPKPPSYTKIADTHMAAARAFVPTLENIGLLSDIKMDTIADTSNELIIYTAKFKDCYNSLSHTLEVLHKKSRILKKKKNLCIEKLFDERSRIFSEALQSHYRNIGESLAGGSGSIAGEESTMVTGDSNATSSTNHGQYAEGSMESYSTDGSTHGRGSREMLAEADELPSYYQHQQESGALFHRRTGSLGSPAHSSSASSSLSLNSPPYMAAADSPPDYVRNEHPSSHHHSLGTVVAGPTMAMVGHMEDEDTDALFQAYHRRYDTRQRQDSNPRSRPNVMVPSDTPPGYDETQYHVVVDPV